MDPAKSTEKNTRIKTNLFLTLENMVQDYIETKQKTVIMVINCES
jgi:hypothetical protein